MKENKLGFTLIEMLVVVLIIGVLGAIALPQYNKAVLRSRFHALMPIAHAMADSNEAYYLEHGVYSADPEELPVEGKEEYPEGTKLEFGDSMEYAYVKAMNDSTPNNYIVYQQNSHNYPGEIHCEAKQGNALAQSICAGIGGTQNIGQTLTDGYVTYVIEGEGMGFPFGTDTAANCGKATERGFECNMSTNEDGQMVKQICTTVSGVSICRSTIYDDEGDGYTSITCKTNADKVCTSNLSVAVYGDDGNKISTRNCGSVDENGNCTVYSNGYDYQYNAAGNKLSERYCTNMDGDGNCITYSSGTEYTYDAEGKKIKARNCNGYDDNGNCTSYNTYSNYDYFYDEAGNMKNSRYCDGVDSNGNCTGYSSGTYYQYDSNGNMIHMNNCNQIDAAGNCTQYSSGSHVTYDDNGNVLKEVGCHSYYVTSSGSCRAYSSGIEYTYDDSGRKTGYLTCDTINSQGNCTAYSTRYDYMYDAAGNKTKEMYCNHSAMDSNWKCTSYSSGEVFTYDDDGNQTSRLVCATADSNGNCTSYRSGSSLYMYDDNGKQIAQQSCSVANLDTTTGECRSYSSPTVQAN